MGKPDINERRKEAKIDIDTLENAIRILKSSGVLVEKADFNKFIEDNEDDHKVLKEGYEDLKSLIPLIPTLTTISENQLVIQKGTKWFVKGVATIGIIIGIIYTLYTMITGQGEK